EESLSPYRTAFSNERIRAIVSIPLILGDGVFGEFMLCYPEPHECMGDELAIAQAIATHIAIATERTRSELARSLRAERLQAILDNSPTVMFLKDLQGRYVFINRRYEELFGVTKEA